jgi:carbonic anhydrase
MSAQGKANPEEFELSNPMHTPPAVVLQEATCKPWMVIVGLAVTTIAAVAVGFGVAYGYHKTEKVTTVKTVPFWPAFVEEGAATWSYAVGSEDGPSAWGEVANKTTNDKFFPTCEDTAQSTQSPIDLPTPVALNAVFAALDTSYPFTSYQIVERPGGHPGFQVKKDTDQSSDGYLMVDGDQYNFAQFHFHSPSEHTINGKQYPLEVHFVHQKAGGTALSVFGMLFDYDEDDNSNPALNTFWNDIFHARAGLTSVSISDILAQAGPIYQRYNGSLTTPPCSEGVKWHVAVSDVGINEVQKLVFTYALNGIENFRPVQSLNGRTIDTFTSAGAP